ncbi:MAG: hypothetical protein QQN41_10005 [Nitrosopumilus sp.]
MREIKPKKGIHYISGTLHERYLFTSPEDMYNSPRIRLSADWETEQLRREITATIANISSFDQEAVTELKGEITQIKNDINKNTNLLQVNNDLLLELLNLLKLQASQAYFWSASWIASEREAQDDIEQGKIHTFSTSSQIIKFLHDD